jgi:transcriptional regulator with XRE-family HTH domain
MPADARPLLVAFGTAVRGLRIARNLTQEELADRAGMHVTYVSGIERGVRNASLVNLDRLAGGLGLDLSALMAALDEHRGN